MSEENNNMKRWLGINPFDYDVEFYKKKGNFYPNSFGAYFG